ncbi:MAG: HYR domain-containing protein, partial [Bacteroidota bacterium]
VNGNVIPFTSPNQVIGKAFFNGGFQDSEDFFFQINQTTPTLEITGLSDIVQSNDEGACGASITLPTPEILNGGEGVVVTTSLEAEPGSEVNFPIGDTEVIYTATDEINEQVTTDTIIVTVNDTELPSITCLNDISSEVSPDANGDIITFSPPPFSDNCPDPVLEQIQGLPSGSLFPIGTTTVTFRVTDASGNLNTCSFNVTVTQANNVPDVTPILECVLNNGDGTLRAYFGYENLNEGEVEIPLGENNNFSGFEDPNQGQGIIFEAGRVSGAFSIVFPANGQVTWNLGTGSATASISSNLCNLTPILESECIKNEAVSGGDFAVDFGYENGESFTLEIPIGSQNQISGGGLEGDNQGQPTVFLPGRQVEVFEVPFDGSDLFWNLNGTSTNIANTELEPCSP